LISQAAAQRQLAEDLKDAKNEQLLIAQQSVVDTAGTKGSTDLERMTSVFEAEKKMSELKIQFKREELDKLVAMEGASAAEIQEIKNELQQLTLNQEKELIAYLKEASAERMDVAETEWRRGIINAEEYAAAVQVAFDTGAIGAEELRTRTLAATGSMWDNFKEGTYQAMEGVQSLGEFMQTSGKQMFESFGNGMSDAFSSFLEGTKSAKEAMADFARSFLIEIQRMIVKQLVFNALKAVAGFGMSEGGLVPSFASGGRIPGNSPTSTSDNIKINATAGEFMQPVSTVKYYGEDLMEALRRKIIPKSLFTSALGGFNGKLPSLGRTSYSLASGGSVPKKGEESVASAVEQQKQPINIINVTDPREISNYLATSEGSNALMNVLSSKAQTLKRHLDKPC